LQAQAARHGERTEDESQFVDFQTVGCSGALANDLDMLAVADAVRLVG